MRRAIPAALGFACLWSCGYVGPVLPPSPKVPLAITDLGATERGNRIVLSYTTPTRTEDAVDIEEPPRIEVRVGEDRQPFDRWLAGSRLYTTPVFPAADWEGKQIAIQMRTAVKQRGGESQWSNRVTLRIIPPLRVPSITVEPRGDGYHVGWEPGEGATSWEIRRQGPQDTAPTTVGVSDHPPYVDGTAAWDTIYRYSVLAKAANAESLPSNIVEVKSADVFPPAVPSNATALRTPKSIEVNWSRNTETDLKGYAVFRSIDGGPFQRLGALITVPTISDAAVQPGHRYRYAVSAVDQKDNSSEQSAPTEVAF